MKRRKLLRVLEGAAFCAALLCTLAFVSRTVERKASVNRLKPFIDRAQEIDVLFAGDSHVVNDVFPMELWRDYGIASYNIASYGNTLPVTYWTVMNALDYAEPELVVIGVMDADKEYKLTGSSSDVHTAFDGYPLTRTKIRAIEDLMADSYEIDDDGNFYADMRWEYYFTLGKYHTRWSELDEGDFHYSPNGQKGAQFAIGVAEPNDYEIIDGGLASEEKGWGFIYLRRLIEELQGRGIDVLLVNLPYPASAEQQEAANAVYYVAQDYGVEYIDFVYLDQVVDYKIDCYDPTSHLNPSGARKVTDYLGRYIASHYAVLDRRGDARWAAWDADYGEYLAYKARLLGDQGSLRQLLMLLHDESFSVCVSIVEGSQAYRDAKLLRLLQNIAREHVFEDDEEVKWADALMPLEELDDAAAQREAYFMLVDRGAENGVAEVVGAADAVFETSFGTLRYSTDGGAPSLVLADGSDCFAVEDGETVPDVQVLIVDDRTGETVAVMRY